MEIHRRWPRFVRYSGDDELSGARLSVGGMGRVMNARRWQQLTVSITVIVIGFTVVWMAVAWSSVWTLTAIFAKRPHDAAAEFRNVWLPVSAAMLQGGLSGPLAASVIGRDMRRARWLCNAYGIVMASYLAWLFVPDRTPLSIVAVAVVAATAFVVARRRSSWISWLAGVWAAAAILGMTFGVSKDEPVMSAGVVLFMIAIALLARYASNRIDDSEHAIPPAESMGGRMV